MTRVPGGLVVVGLLTLAAALLAGCRSRPPVLETPPGAAARPADVVARLAAALAAKGPDYRPHTRHLRPDGTPRWTNRLILAASPYLLQHAHNPVDWYPWGDEVFDRARREGKPVLLSIGYSTCHWCHVMEEESFEDEEVARALNEHYVAIKVDREERPDLDEAYMTAVQLMTRSGGWPMTVWLTPERRPFYGGTYFPARDGDRGIPTGFLTLLTRLHEIFVADPLRVAAQADRVVAAVESLGTPAPGDAPPDASALRAAVATWSASFDPEHGGFGPAPRFPTPAALDVLLRWHRRTGDPRALAMVTATLEHMAAGGIHDQVGGGFHRYATDVAWTVPHFEKTLPDNAALAATYVTAWQATGRPEFAAVARDVLDWLAREMSDPRGGFWSATDADSGTGEGAFFTWTPAEVEAVLPPDAAAAVEAFFDVRAPGSSGGRSILHAPRPLAAVAAERGTTPEALAATLAAARAVLRAARDRRPRPATDTKIVAAWNGLAISAFARAGAALGDRAYVARAEAAARFALDGLGAGGTLRRADTSPVGGFLDDHALLAAGLLDLWDATFDPRWLREALHLQRVLARDFWDDASGGFFTTAARAEAPLAREKRVVDDPLPAGNAVAVDNLLRLAELTGDDAHRRRADATLRALGRDLARSPTDAARLLAALERRLDRAKEIVIVAPAGRPETAAPLLAVVRRTWLPNAVLAVQTEGPALDAVRALVPLLEGKRALDGRATAYVCEERVCAHPTTEPDVLAAALAPAAPLP